MVLNNGKEIMNKVIETVEDSRQLDEKRVLEQTKHDLQHLKSDLTYASRVIDELQKAGWIDMSTKSQRESALSVPEQREGAINAIVNKVEEIRTKFDTLGQPQKEKISKMTEALRQSRSALSGLKEEVTESSENLIEKAESDIVTAANQKMAKYPAWLREGYEQYVHRKMTALKGEKIQENGRWDKVKHIIADGFFALVGGRLVGKEITDKLDNAKDYIADKGKQITDKYEDIKEQTEDKLKEFSPDQLKEKEKNLRNYIKVLVGKYGKDIDDATLERVVKRLNVKKLASDNTTEIQKIFSNNRADTNLAESLFEGISLPFYFGRDVLQALQAEGIIDYSEVAYHAAGESISYGLKGFKVFGTGLKVSLGSISMKNIGSELKRVYDKSPDAGKMLIRAMMYRTSHSPLFKLALNSAELMAKATLRPLMESKEDIKSLSHISDGLKGNMNTAVRELEEFVKYLPEGETKFIKDIIVDFKKEVAAFEEINHINTIYREVTTYNHTGSIPLEEIEKRYMKRTGGKSPFLARFKDANTGVFQSIPESSFASAMETHTRNIGDTVKTNLKKADLTQGFEVFWGKTKSAMKLKPNEISVLEDSIRYLDATTNRYANMMNNRGWFASLRDLDAGVRGGILNIKETLPEGKTYFNFKTAEDFEGFMKKMKYLGKQSPETLKFIIGKTPIFLVGGMTLSGDGSMSEKMKQLSKDVWGLVPIIGPGVIIWDASNLGKLASGDPETRGQMGLGATLAVTDGRQMVKFANRGQWGKFLRYVFQPVTDMLEIMKFTGNVMKNSFIVGKDALNVARNRGVRELGEDFWKFMRTEGRLGRAGLAVALVAGGYVTWEYLFASNDIDDKTKQDIAKYKDNPDQLDRDLEKGWATMKQEERNDYLRAALLRQGGISPDKIDELTVQFDPANKRYTMVLPSIMNADQVRAIKENMTDALQRVQPGSSIDMQFYKEARYYFTKELAEQFADVTGSEKKTKMEEYARAMGYDNPSVVLSDKAI